MTQSDIAIRHARLEDSSLLYDLVWELEDSSPFLLCELRCTGLGRGAFTRRLGRLLSSPNSTVTVAAMDREDRTELYGYLFAMGGHVPGIHHMARINGMGVLPSCRRRGLGLGLLQFTENWAAQVGILRLELSVVLGNDAAQDMYRRAGFMPEGVLRAAYNFDGRLEDGWIMSKLLPPLATDTP